MVFLKYLGIYFLGYLIAAIIGSVCLFAWAWRFETKNSVIMLDAAVVHAISGSGLLAGLAVSNRTLYNAIVIGFWPIALPWTIIEHIILIKKYYTSRMNEEP